jgi:hypothetical protein
MDNERIVNLFRDPGGPGLSEDAKTRIAARALEQYERARPSKPPGFLERLAGSFADLSRGYKLAGLAAGVAALFLLGVFTGRGLPHEGEKNAPQEVAVAAAAGPEREKLLLAQFDQVFGDRLQAVITRGGKMQIVLSETGGQRGQPVLIHLKADDGDVDIMSFSGSKVSLAVDGKQVSFDTLVDGKGDVILAGDNVFWQAGKGQVEGAPEVRIGAKPLEM